MRRYLHRAAAGRSDGAVDTRMILRRMLIGACLSGVALLGTWGSIQWAANWAGTLVPESEVSYAKAYTQMFSGFGAILGTIVAAVIGSRIGRRPGYALLCLGALGSSFLFFRFNHEFGPMFLATVFVAGGLTASFYGWLPLYLPELFPTRVRATGQGFSFNFGRTLAAVGTLHTGYLMKDVFNSSFPLACSTMSLVYLVGLAIIWFAPETHGKPLPE